MILLNKRFIENRRVLKLKTSEVSDLANKFLKASEYYQVNQGEFSWLSGLEPIKTWISLQSPPLSTIA